MPKRPRPPGTDKPPAAPPSPKPPWHEPSPSPTESDAVSVSSKLEEPPHEEPPSFRSPSSEEDSLVGVRRMTIQEAFVDANLQMEIIVKLTAQLKQCLKQIAERVMELRTIPTSDSELSSLWGDNPR